VTVTTDDQQRLAEEAAIRANLYRVAVAFFLKPPTGEFLTALGSAPLLPFDVDSDWSVEELVQEHNDLFQVPAGSYVFPYESCYQGRRGGAPSGMMGKPAIQVREFYGRAGYEVAAEAAELPDHAGVEFGLLQLLAEKEAEAWRAGEEEMAKRWQLWQSVFLTRHLTQWIPDLCSEISAKTSQPYFSRFASWIKDFVEEAVSCASDCPLNDLESSAKVAGGRSLGAPKCQSSEERI
jgi:TorA maturation chaperone TorD